jgi:hypothetical protein
MARNTERIRDLLFILLFINKFISLLAPFEAEFLRSREIVILAPTPY